MARCKLYDVNLDRLIAVSFHDQITASSFAQRVTPPRQVVFVTGRMTTKQERPIERMKRKFDTLVGRFIYNKRLSIVEPVFGNLKNKGLARLTLRTKANVDAQWKLFTLVHDIEKIAHCGAR